jgi:GDP-L-fucose synthase
VYLPKTRSPADEGRGTSHGAARITNEPYALAKIAGIKLCENYNRQYGSNFVSVMPTNLYGPSDNFDPDSSHVIPGLIRKFQTAKQAGATSVDVWGSGTPLREFLYVDDLAEAVVFLLENLDAEKLYGSGISHINIGSGTEITIRDLAHLIGSVTGFEGASILISQGRMEHRVSFSTAHGFRRSVGKRKHHLKKG